MNNSNGRTLSKPIGHAPVSGDLPRLNRVVQSRHAERGIQGFVPVFGDLCSRRLNLTQFVRAARLNLGLLPVPIPRVTEPGMRHAMRDPFDLGVVPAPATVGGHFHLLDGSATGPGQAANLVESAARKLVSSGRESDDRFGPDLVPQRSGFRILVKMPKLVVVHV